LLDTIYLLTAIV